MSDEPKRRARAWIAWTAGVLLLLAYPLSMGPVTSYAINSGNLRLWQIANTAYAPIGWLRAHSEPLRSLIDWYMGFWGNRVIN